MTQRFPDFAIALLLIGVIAQPAWAGNGLADLSSQALQTEARTVLGHAKPDKVSEKRLEQVVLTLGARTPSPGARKLVEELSTRQPQIMVPHEEGDVMIPFVDVGATARYTLRNWTRIAAYEEASRATRAGEPQFLQNYFAADAARQTGMIDAIGNAKPKDLVLYRDGVLDRISLAGGDQLAAAFAATLADTTLLERVIAEASAPVALQTVRNLVSITDAATALTLMQVAVGRSDIASATLFEVGRLTSTMPAAERFLWQLLDDAELGGSAAAVLARHADSETVNRLVDLLQNSDSELVRKRIVLALRLSGDARAMQVVNNMTDEWLNRQPGNIR